MTENEAIKWLREMQNPMMSEAELYCAETCYGSGKMVYPEPEDYVFETAIQALEEIQQYRAMEEKLNGISVEQVVNGFIKTVENQTEEQYECGRILTNAEADMWNEYRAIGTVEDIQMIFQLCKDLQVMCGKYHAIGTVEECEADKIFAEQMYEYNVHEKIRLLAKYEAIGTVEEFKALKEKNEDCIIEHLTGECSYNKTGCSDCKSKLKIKDLLEKNVVKKARDNTNEFIEKLIGRLEEARETVYLEYEYDQEIAYRDSIRIVNQLAEEYSGGAKSTHTDGWIPCSKRLPEDNGRYLVRDHKGRVYEIEFMYCTWCVEQETSYIIEWMPLPRQHQPQTPWKQQMMNTFDGREV